MDCIIFGRAVIFSCLVLLSTTRATLVAKFNMGGVTGTITFSPSSQGQAVDVVLDLTGLRRGYYYELELHEFRVNYDTSNRCAPSNIGNRLGDAITGITSGSGSLQADGFALSGPTSIEGRSFLLTNNDRLTVCATVESDEEYITAFAHLPANIGGTMVFRQMGTDSSADTTIYYELFHAVENKPSGALKWQINNGVVAMDINAHTGIQNRCGSSIGEMYNPTASTGNGCAANNHVRCKIGDLSGKHGDITLNVDGKTRGFFPDLHLPLSGTDSIIGKTIVFKIGDLNYACANVVAYPAMSAESKFSNEGVEGFFSFSQKSPYDLTTIHINLDNLDGHGGGYHVHNWPVPQRIEQSDTICGPEDVSGHLNPFNLNVSSDTYPAIGTGTPDQYEIGDISGKFGSFSGMESSNFTHHDPNLPLFGVHSIIGRSMVIHKDLPGSPRWICSTIWPTGEMVTAVAKFQYPVIGYMILRQAMRDSETQIYAELNYAAIPLSPTVSHNWHIHQSQIGDDMLAASGRCSSVGPHYNPYNVSLMGDYSTACNPSNQFRCELGDLVGKHGQLNVRKSDGTPHKYFFTDMQLPLSGPQSVVGRSIVIHDANSGGGRLSCANVHEKPTRTAAVTSWTSADPTASVSGSIKFRQDSTDTLSSIAHFEVELAGLKDSAGGYHVHLYPASGAEMPQEHRCTNKDVGGHHNPFSAPYPGPQTGTDDQYEIGDLSGKDGFLLGSRYSTTAQDTNLPMEGPRSIVGRSIVIHKNDAAASRWVCGTIEETTAGATKIMAVAHFKAENNGIVGSVTMTQYRYSNGDMSDTTFVVDVTYEHDGDHITLAHDWRVHENPITAGDCNTAGNHYNPFKVDTGSSYSTECSMHNPLRCEAGDLSGKVGRYDIGSGRNFYTDVNINLEGKFSAAKRSIVFNAAEGSSTRIACANIIPYNRADNTIYVLRFLSVDFIRSQLEKKVADSIETEAYNIQAEHFSSDFKCKAVKLYFLGADAAKLRASFVDIIKGHIFAKLEPFAPSSECGTGSAGLPQISLVILLIGAILSRLLKS